MKNIIRAKQPAIFISEMIAKLEGTISQNQDQSQTQYTKCEQQ